MNDTPIEIAKLVRERMLARSSEERMQMGNQMFEVARAMILASFPPGLSEIETKRLLCQRLYGNEVDVEGFVAYLEARSHLRDSQNPETKIGLEQ